MTARVLVAYASRYGSTQEVALAVASTLGDSGLEVDLRSVASGPEAMEYHAVVVGARVVTWTRRLPGSPTR